MFGLKFEINGREVDLRDGKGIEDAMTQALVEAAIETVNGLLTVEEASQLTFKVKDGASEDLTLIVSGPEEIVEKVEQNL